MKMYLNSDIFSSQTPLEMNPELQNNEIKYKTFSELIFKIWQEIDSGEDGPKVSPLTLPRIKLMINKPEPVRSKIIFPK